MNLTKQGKVYSPLDPSKLAGIPTLSKRALDDIATNGGCGPDGEAVGDVRPETHREVLAIRDAIREAKLAAYRDQGRGFQL